MGINLTNIEKKFLKYYNENLSCLTNCIQRREFKRNDPYGHFGRRNIWDYVVDHFCDQLTLPESIYTQYMPIDRKTFIGIVRHNLKKKGTWYRENKDSKFEKLANKLHTIHHSLNMEVEMLQLMKDAPESEYKNKKKSVATRNMGKQIDKSGLKLQEIEKLIA